MKKIALSFALICIALTFNSCSNSNSDEVLRFSISDSTSKVDQVAGIIDRQNSEIEKDLATASDKLLIPVGAENFSKLAVFIERHGFSVPQNGVPCDRQYNFVDSQGNRHALMTIRRDDAGRPSAEGKVRQISVWAYIKNIKDQEHFFGYRINEANVAPFAFELDGSWKNADKVKLGYEELLAKAGK